MPHLPHFPLPDEPHLEAWRAYAAEAAHIGALPALATKLVQLSFPIEAGISQTPAYQAATRRGTHPLHEVPETSLEPTSEVPNEVLPNEVPETSLERLRGAFREPETIHLSIAETIAGGLPVVHIPHRQDFVTLVRMLTARNEPILVPTTMGACLVSGLNNWHRIGLLRRQWQGEHPRASEGAWKDAFRELQRQKELYQDRLVLVTEGPYSAVPAAELGLGEEEWKTLSAHIRLTHESTHYLTWRVLGAAKDPWLEEILADFAGLLTAFGSYRKEWALWFLGLNETGYHQSGDGSGDGPGGRLKDYRGDPPLSEEALEALRGTVATAVCQLAQWTRPREGELAQRETLASTILHLRRGTLDDLAAGRTLQDGALHG